MFNFPFKNLARYIEIRIKIYSIGTRRDFMFLVSQRNKGLLLSEYFFDSQFLNSQRYNKI